MADPPPVLVVEDNEDSRSALVWVLELGGYGAVGAGTAAEALAWLRAGNRPCLVILDLRLPDMTGDALYTAIREEPGGASIPVVVHTGVDDRPAMPGLAGTVVKGSSPDALLAVLDQACGRRTRSGGRAG